MKTETICMKDLVLSSRVTPSCPCSLLRMTHLTVDAEIICWLPRILFTQTPSCRVKNASCLMTRHDNNRKPCPTLLSSLTSNPRSRFLIIVPNYIYCHICLSNFLAWYVQCTKTPVSCCSFISQVISHWIGPKVSKQLNAVTHVTVGLEGYRKVWHIGPLDYSWLTCLKNSIKWFYLPLQPISLKYSLPPQGLCMTFLCPWNTFPLFSLSFLILLLWYLKISDHLFPLLGSLPWPPRPDQHPPYNISL